MAVGQCEGVLFGFGVEGEHGGLGLIKLKLGDGYAIN